MTTDRWAVTTHEWSRSVDAEHLGRIRADPERFAPGGVLHLVLEVLAYASEEADDRSAGRCVVRLHRDGSVSVDDDGRGTDTRLDEHGQPVRKPVMSTRDVRFFDTADAPLLPDGHPRRGISTVAALSARLVHTNRRTHGSWSQRYEHGVPVTDLVPLDPDGTTGTSVRLLPDARVVPGGLPTGAPDAWVPLLRTWPTLVVDVVDDRPAGAG
ncbi:ATP-binding protein [Actinotalea sp. AC32]|nr:ATP-binding protein [Actinotalea sp. AC32]